MKMPEKNLDQATRRELRAENRVTQREMERLLAALLESLDRTNKHNDYFPFPFRTIEKFGCMEEAVRPLLSRLVEYGFAQIAYYPKRDTHKYDPLNRWQPAYTNDPYSKAVRDFEPEIQLQRDQVKLLHKRLSKKLGVKKMPEIFCQGLVLYINGRKIKCDPTNPSDSLLLKACGQLNKPVPENIVRELLKIPPGSTGARDLIHAATRKMRTKTRLTGENLSSKGGTITAFGKRLQNLPK